MRLQIPAVPAMTRKMRLWHGSELPASSGIAWVDRMVQTSQMTVQGFTTMRLLAVAILLIVSVSARASTDLTVEPRNCVRKSDQSVSCHFRIRTSTGKTTSITGGQYSRGLGSGGESYVASGIRSQEDSGLAIPLELSAGEWNTIEVQFDGVSSDLEQFSALVLRFDDGYWQGGRVPIQNNPDEVINGCRR